MMNKPVIVSLMGLPGAGKSTCSNVIMEKNEGWHLLVVDNLVREKKMCTNNIQDISLIYHELAIQALNALQESKNIILDATFAVAQYREIVHHYLCGHYSHWLYILVHASKETFMKRLQERTDNDPLAGNKYFAQYEMVKQDFDVHFIPQIPNSSIVHIDSSQAYYKLVRQSSRVPSSLKSVLSKLLAKSSDIEKVNFS